MQLKGGRAATGGTRGDQRGDQRGGRGRGRGGRGRGGATGEGQDGNKVCQSYNGFWTGTGCAYEFNNNRKCGYEHYCSSCFDKAGTKELHKACYCSPDGRNTVGVTGGVKPTVTSG